MWRGRERQNEDDIAALSWAETDINETDINEDRAVQMKRRFARLGYA